MDKVLIATVDEEWNQFVINGFEYKFISKVPEFTNNIEQESENGIFFIDYFAFTALGYNGFPLRPTRVFLKGDTELGYDSHCVTSPYSELRDMISQNHDKTIYFMGDSQFILDVLPYITRINICVVPKEHNVNHTVKFPFEVISEFFLGITDQEPKLLEFINRLKEQGVLEETDKLYKCPTNYRFHEFLRDKTPIKIGESNIFRSDVMNFMTSHQPPQHSTLIVSTETLEIRGRLGSKYRLGKHQWSLELSIREMITRYKKGEDFKNDKTNIVSYIEANEYVEYFRYKKLNGLLDIEELPKFNELLSELAVRHLVLNDIWNIKLQTNDR